MYVGALDQTDQVVEGASNDRQAVLNVHLVLSQPGTLLFKCLFVSVCLLVCVTVCVFVCCV